MEARNNHSGQEEDYILDNALKAAIEVALDLKVPLLLTGEPGTGKTSLADHVAKHILNTETLKFNTKTTSKAKDLLYRYNALLHFRDSQAGKQDPEVDMGGMNTMNYISFEALGKAILDSDRQRYVVLVDEIDKAPRDFPNDVLYEFEKLSFRVEEASKNELEAWETTQREEEQRELKLDEQGFFHVVDKEHTPVLILTSNSEKNLPEAFLRRCAYYHIPFPGKKQLMEIVKRKQPLNEEFKQGMLDAAIDHFLAVRKSGLKKKPATAELISWIHILKRNEVDLNKLNNGATDEEIVEKLMHSYVMLVKNKEDRELLLGNLKKKYGWEKE